MDTINATATLSDNGGNSKTVDCSAKPVIEWVFPESFSGKTQSVTLYDSEGHARYDSLFLHNMSIDCRSIDVKQS